MMRIQSGNGWVSRLLYGGDDELMLHPRRKSMDGFLQQTMCNISYGILTGGIFLSGYLIWLGIPDRVLTLLSSAQMVCGFVPMLLAPWLDRKRRRRRLMITICIISRFFQLSIIGAPWLWPGIARPYAVALSLFLGAAVAAVNDVVFNTWFAAVIPDPIKGRYYALRQRAGVIVSLLVSLLTSVVMDLFQEAQYSVFAVIYAVAFLVTVCEVRALSGVDDVELEPGAEKVHFRDLVRVPAAHREFMRYMLLCGLLYLFWFLSTSFDSIFQLKYLQMSYTYINVTGLLRQLLQLMLFYKVWGLICDKIGNSFALFCSIGFQVVNSILWATLSTNTMWIVYPVINILGAVGQTGFAMALFNRRYELIPEKGKVVYESFFSATIGIVVLIGPILGGLLRDFLAKTPVMQIEFGNIRTVYLVSAFLITLLLLGYARSLRDASEKNTVLNRENFRRCGALLVDLALRRR